MRLAGLAVVLCAAACTYERHVHVHVNAPSAPPPVKVAYAEEPTFPVQDPLDAIVRIASVNGECSGTVVGDRLVVTARACFDRITTAKTFATDRVRARIGGGFVPWKVIPVIAVLGAKCTGVAVMVTDDPIPDAAPLRMRLGARVAIGEPVRVVGFGRCSGRALGERVVSPRGFVRELGDSEIATSVPTCPGDAGGPLISEWTGEVVGVLQGDPVTADTSEPASAVVGGVSRIDVARGLLAQAFLVAHGVEPEHLPPISCE